MDDEDLLTSVTEFAEDEDVPVEEVRAWCAENDVQMVGNSYVLTFADREAFREDLAASEEEAEDEEDDEEEEDEDDENEDAA